MSKRGPEGVDTLPEDYSWLQILLIAFNPASMENARKLQREEHLAQQAYLRNQAIQNPKKASSEDSQFTVKQLAGKYNCEFETDRFPKDSEMMWIRTIESIARQDQDPDHNNQNMILRRLHNIDPKEAKKLIAK